MAGSIEEERKRRDAKFGPLGGDAAGGASLWEQTKQLANPVNLSKGLAGFAVDTARTVRNLPESGPRALSQFANGNYTAAGATLQSDLPLLHDVPLSFAKTARTIPYSPLIAAQLGAGAISNDWANSMENSLDFLPGYKAAADRYEEQPVGAIIEDLGNIAIVAGGVGKALGTGASAAEKGAAAAALNAEKAAAPATFRMAEEQALAKSITARRMAGEVIDAADSEVQAWREAHRAAGEARAAEAPVVEAATAEANRLGAKADKLRSLSNTAYKVADLDPIHQLNKQVGKGLGMGATYLAENTKFGAAAKDAIDRTIFNPAQRKLASIKAGADANAEAEIVRTLAPVQATAKILGEDDRGLQKIYLSLSDTGEGSLVTTNALGMRDAFDKGLATADDVAKFLKEQLPTSVKDLEDYNLTIEEFVRATDILRGEGPTVAEDLAKISAADPQFQQFVNERQSAYQSGRGEKITPTDEELARRASRDPMAPIKQNATEEYRTKVHEPQRQKAQAKLDSAQARVAERQASLARVEDDVAQRATNAVGRVKSAIKRAAEAATATGRGIGSDLAGARNILSKTKDAVRALERHADALERKADRMGAATNARRTGLADKAETAGDAAAAQVDELATRSGQAREDAGNKAQAEADQLALRAQELRGLADDLEAQLTSIDPGLRKYDKLAERVRKVRERADRLDQRAGQRFQERLAQGERAAETLDQRATAAAQRSVDQQAAAAERLSSFEDQQLLGREAGKGETRTRAQAENARRQADVRAAVGADDAAARQARAQERTEAGAARTEKVADTIPDREAARLEKGGKRLGKAEEQVAQAQRELDAAQRNLDRLDAKFEKVKQNIENNPKFAPPEARPALMKARRAQAAVRQIVSDISEQGQRLLDEAQAARRAGQREVAAELEDRAWGMADQANAMQEVADGMLTTYQAMLDEGVNPRMLAGGIVGAPNEGRVAIGGLGMDKKSSLAREKMRVSGTTPLTLSGQAQAARSEIQNAWANEMVREGEKLVGMNADDVVAALQKRAATARRLRSGSAAEQLDATAARLPTLRGRALIDEMRAAGYEAWNPDSLFGTETALTVGPETMWVPKPLMEHMRAYYKDAGGIERLIGEPLDKVTNVFKILALPLSPRWYVGNAGGNMLLATIGGGMTPLDLWNYGLEARRLLKDQRGGLFDAARGRADGSIGMAVPGTALDPRLAGASGTRELYDFINQEEAVGGRVRQAGRKMVQRGYDINTWVDDWGHAMYYLYAADKKGMSHEAALQASLKVMGDMSALSPFERNVVKRVLPFYPWMRHVTQLAFSLPIEHPGRVAATLHLSNLFSGQYEEDMQDLPPMLEDLYQIDEDTFLKLPNLNPFDEGMFSLLTPQGVLKSLNPAIRTGLAVSTGFDTGTGKFLNSPPGTEHTDWYGNRTMGFLSPDQAAYVIARGMVPQVGTIQKMLPGEPRRYATGEPVGYGKMDNTSAASALGQYLTGTSVTTVEDLPQQQQARYRRERNRERALSRYQRGVQ